MQNILRIEMNDAWYQTLIALHSITHPLHQEEMRMHPR